MPSSRPVSALLLVLSVALAGADQGEATSPASISTAAERLAAYVRIDTSNPPGNEAAAAELLAAILQARGFATERYVSPGGRTSLAARLPATGAAAVAAPVLVLMHHLDVVPAGTGGSAPPFAGEIRDGRLWGRGAIDAKSLGIAQLEAFLAAAELSERRRELLFLAVADEEAGGIEGTKWLLERHPELFARVEAVLNEGGQNRTVLGRTLFWGIEITQKRPLWLELAARGRSGHGSALNVESAAHRLIAALARALDAPPGWRVSPAARAHFEALAAFDPQARSLAASFDHLLGPDGPTRDLLPGMAGYFLDTLQITRLEASERINVVAPVARAWLDVRLLPDTDAEGYLRALRERLGAGIEVRVLLDAPEVAASPADTSLYAELAVALGQGTPVVPVFIAGVTDSRWLRTRGIAAYGVQPFELEWPELGTVHGPDERIPLAVFESGVERMIRVVRALVAREGVAR